MLVIQKLSRKEPSRMEVAQRYYSIISAVNGLNLTKRELQLLAFTALKGNMSYANIRQEFCQMFDSSEPTINNMISKLKKNGILVKEGSKIKVHPVLSLDFTKDVLLGIKLTSDDEKQDQLGEAHVDVHEGLSDKGDVGAADEEREDD
jgi:DNA-binding Lrp family transcriptional regulator